MKIGILTYHFVSNFGANLQTLSTFCYLEKVGHTPIIINWRPADLEEYYSRVVPKIQNNAFNKFADEKYTNITNVCRTSKDIAAVIDKNEIDMVVVGSDAVLTYIPFLERFHICRRGVKYVKPCIDSDFPNAFWGDFLQYTKRNIKVSLMSVSAQNTRYSRIIFKKQFNEALHRFNYISVRDIWTQKMISYLTSGQLNVQITPDPVFAFNQNVGDKHQEEYISQKYHIKERYAIISVYDKKFNNEWITELSRAFEDRGVFLYFLPQANKQRNKTIDNTLSFPIDPIDWYCLIKNSQAYIGELMHPILVSLHNAVPIYAIDTYGFKANNNIGINPESIKTYQIITRFNVLDNYYNVNSSQAVETPQNVVEKIFSFDRLKCAKCAQIMYNDYIQMMDKILKIK